MINDNQILHAMELYGGSFAACIARAACRADAVNYQKLKSAFPDLWKEYADMAALIDAQQGKIDAQQGEVDAQQGLTPCS